MAATSRPSFFICSRALDLLDQGVPFRLRHVEPGGVLLLELGPGHGFGVAAEDDVGAAAGHVRGDGHGALAAGLGDDLRLALVMLGVEHLVLHPALVEHPRDAARSSRWRPCRPRAAGPALDLDDLALGNLCRCLSPRGMYSISSSVSLAIVPSRSSPFSSRRTSHLCIRSISSTMAANFSRSVR